MTTTNTTPSKSRAGQAQVRAGQAEQKTAKQPKPPKAKKAKGEQVIDVPLSKLAHHSLLDLLPPIDLDSPEFNDLVLDIQRKGVAVPAMVVPGKKAGEFLLIDGRNREAGSRHAGRETIPAILKKEEEARDIILSALVHRKHFGKGALAYCCVPLLKQAAEAAKAKKLANLMQGEKASEGEETYQTALTLEEECIKMGFSRELYSQAARVREIFAENHDYKVQMEPKILSGDVGLGAVIAGAAGRSTTTGKPKPAANYLHIANGKPIGLMPKSLITLSNGFQNWNNLDLGARAAFKAEWDSLLAILPADLK